MKRTLWIACCAAVLVTAASIIPGPYSSVLEAKSGPPGTGQVDPRAAATLRQVCANCHSNVTVWPWYSHIAPMSWMVRRDVSQARTFLNFSQWDEYGAEGQSQLLALAADKVASGDMPPPRYALLHPEAQFTSQQKQLLVEALRRESSRLNKKQ